jgi:6-pyruvoyltetrahydropterin/6-carboxytetrahydropterin synthase
MYTISKEFHFSASHRLEGLPEDHPCSRLHGHNYVVIVELRATSLNEVSFVQDYRELQEIKDFIDQKLDHRHLNDIFSFQTSAERLAEYLFGLFKIRYPLLSAVSVSETPKTWARYER